jgi:hypothetical protein
VKDTFFTNKYLFVPVLFSLLIFSIDKLAGLNFVRKYTETRIEYSFYNEKIALLEQLQKYQKNRKPEDKLLVLFGTSHMGEFSNQYISEKYPHITTYNFSAPLAPPSFLYFYLEQILEANIQIDYAILEGTPEGFQDSANRYAIKFSYSPSFVWKYSSVFSKTELETFTSSMLFSSIKYPVRFASIIEKIRKPNSRKQLEYMQDVVRKTTIKNNGGIPNANLYEVPIQFFEREALVYFNQAFSPYRESGTQKFFFNRFINVCKDKNIKLLIYKPVVSEQFQALLDKSSFYKTWTDNLYKMAAGKTDVLDFSNQLQCKKFLDVHHLSGGCYPELTDKILDRLILK